MFQRKSFLNSETLTFENDEIQNSSVTGLGSYMHLEKKFYFRFLTVSDKDMFFGLAYLHTL